jgi:hypothetical protein
MSSGPPTPLPDVGPLWLGPGSVKAKPGIHGGKLVGGGA